MTNTIPSVPRELLERIERCYMDGMSIYGECEEIRALLSAPSPAGVDGCKCSMSVRVLGDGCRHCQPQEYIDRLGEMLDEERAELSDAQAIIDGLRAEVAEERAKVTQLEEGIPRIMEASYQFRQQRDKLAELLRDVRKGVHWQIMANRIDTALSAGKEGK